MCQQSSDVPSFSRQNTVPRTEAPMARKAAQSSLFNRTAMGLRPPVDIRSARREEVFRNRAAGELIDEADSMPNTSYIEYVRLL